MQTSKKPHVQVVLRVRILQEICSIFSPEDHAQKIVKMRDHAFVVMTALCHDMKQVLCAVFIEHVMILIRIVKHGIVVLSSTDKQQIR